jgi:hypothetical protein
MTLLSYVTSLIQQTAGRHDASLVRHPTETTVCGYTWRFSRTSPHWNNSLRVHMTLLSYIIILIQSHKSLLLMCIAAWLGGTHKCQLFCLWFDSTEVWTHNLLHANHYTTDEVKYTSMLYIYIYILDFNLSKSQLHFLSWRIAEITHHWIFNMSYIIGVTIGTGTI